MYVVLKESEAKNEVVVLYAMLYPQARGGVVVKGRNREIPVKSRCTTLL